MGKNRVFTKEELKEMCKPMRDIAVEAIEASDKDRAKELVNRMHDESRECSIALRTGWWRSWTMSTYMMEKQPLRKP